MPMVSTEPRIYVASLSDYNNGVLHGEWIDAAQDADAIREEIAAMLRRSKYPNALVVCPACDGVIAEDWRVGHEAADVQADLEAHPCATCKGTGTVPSAEEWAIHDYDGFEGASVHEFESIEVVAALAGAIAEHGPAFVAYWNNQSGDDVDDAVSAFQDDFIGEYNSLEDYAESFLEETGALQSIPENLRYYFDYAAYARDMRISGDVWTSESPSGVYVFHNS